jgi:pimeloyl-ACP methyl ester carboxylesterase
MPDHRVRHGIDWRTFDRSLAGGSADDSCSVAADCSLDAPCEMASTFAKTPLVSSLQQFSSFGGLSVQNIFSPSRRRLLGATAAAPYHDLERRLATLPAITVPAITIDGDADGVVPATDGRSSAGKFTGGREHRILPRIGHNPPQEAPNEFAAAVLDLVANKQISSQHLKEGGDGRS